MAVTWDFSSAVGMSLTDGDLTATYASGSAGVISTTSYAQSSGAMLYLEFSSIADFSAGGGDSAIGIGTTSVLGSDPVGIAYYVDHTGNPLGSTAEGHVIGVAVDLTNNKCWFRYNDSGLWNNASSGSQNPETNTGGFALSALPSGNICPFLYFVAAGQTVTVNFGDQAFDGVVPTGFIPWGSDMWNPADKTSAIALSNSNLTATDTAFSDNGVRATSGHNSGRWYIEYPNVQASDLRLDLLGFATAAQGLQSSNTDAIGVVNLGGGFGGAGVTSTNSVGTINSHNLQFAIDIDAQLFWARYDGGSWFGQTSGAADPVAGTNGVSFSLTGTLLPCAIFISWDSTAVININAGPSSGFANTPPTGFFPWSGSAPAVGVTGTWASTEAPDTMAAFGLTPAAGTWASTEAPDTWATSSGFAILGLNYSQKGDDAVAGAANTTITGFTTTVPDTIVIVTQFSSVIPRGGNPDPFGAQTITNVTDTGGVLEWFPRFTAVAGITEEGGSMSLCTWWAYAHEVISDPITITAVNTGYGVNTTVVAYAVQGLNGNYAYPWGDRDNYYSLASSIGSFYTAEGSTDPKLLLPFQTGPLGGSPGPTAFTTGNNVTLGGSGTTVTGTGTASSYAIIPDIKAGGRFYFEVGLTTIVDPTTYGFGVMFSSALVSSFLSNGEGGVIVYGNGEIWNGGGSAVGSLGATPSSGDVIGVNIDIDSGNAWFINLSHSGSYWNDNPASNPEFNVGGIAFSASAASQEEIGSNGLTGAGPCSPIAAPCGTSSGGELGFDFAPSDTVPGSFQGWPANGVSASGIYPSMLLAFYETTTDDHSFPALAPPSGFTTFATDQIDNGGITLGDLSSYSVQTTSIPKSANNFLSNGTPSSRWQMVVDTLVCGAVNPGYLAATEAPDTMRAIGYTGAFGQIGFLEAVENPDVMVAFGFQRDSGVWFSTETTDIFSAYGFQPLTGAWNSTESPDTFAGTGIGLGENGVWESTEAVDIFNASGNTPISGSFVTTDTPDRFSALGAGARRSSTRRQTFIT